MAWTSRSAWWNAAVSPPMPHIRSVTRVTPRSISCWALYLAANADEACSAPERSAIHLEASGHLRTSRLRASQSSRAIRTDSAPKAARQRSNTAGVRLFSASTCFNNVPDAATACQASKSCGEPESSIGVVCLKWWFRGRMMIWRMPCPAP